MTHVIEDEQTGRSVMTTRSIKFGVGVREDYLPAKGKSKASSFSNNEIINSCTLYPSADKQLAAFILGAI